MMVQVSDMVRRSSHRDGSRRVSAPGRSWLKVKARAGIWGVKYGCLLCLVFVLFAFWVLFGFLRRCHCKGRTVTSPATGSVSGHL